MPHPVVLDANVHPQTGETLNIIGRMGAFVPCNIPIQAGMLLAAPTVRPPATR